jgi:hypothetical protein
VGFGCPVDDCGCPYLEYHHFDPPWHEGKVHHEPGMIALCPVHHRKADVGTYTNDQLRAWKWPTATPIRGRFDWMRQRIIAVIGGSVFDNVPVMVRYKDQPQIWFERDEVNGPMLLNVKMVSKEASAIELYDNDWILGDRKPDDLICPPSGKLIEIKYSNGDYLKVEFLELASLDKAKGDLAKVSPSAMSQIEFPAVIAQLSFAVGGTPYVFGPNAATVGHGHRAIGCYARDIMYGLTWDEHRLSFGSPD